MQTQSRSAMHETHEINFSHLSFSLGENKILSDISINCTSKRIGVVGRNGSGKSTFARVLAGLVAPTQGTIRVNGKDLYHDRKSALQEIGILFQNPDHQIIFPTVLEEIAFGLRQMGKNKAEANDTAMDVLAKFGKSHWKSTNISSLSQGQKHLLCLMAIVAMKPKMIVLDEPFSGLDIPTKIQLNRYLEDYLGALVHISHDPDDLKTYDQILWIEAGKINASGPAEMVLPQYIQEMKRLGGTDDISELSG